MPINLTDENFEKETQRSDKLALVDFYATWCGPCSLLAPVLEKIEKEFEEKIILLKANVDENPINAQKFQVDRIPMVVLFKEGKPLSAFTGLRPENIIKEWLEKIIKDSGQPQPLKSKQEKTEELIKKYSDWAQNNGFRLNPDRKKVEGIINGLLENENKNGKKYCPCRRLTGKWEEDSKKICPCVFHKDEIEKDGRCFCGLFLRL